MNEFLAWSDQPLVHHTAVAAAIVLLFALFARTVRMLLKLAGRKIFARTSTDLDDRILEAILSHFRPLMVVIGLAIGLKEVRKGITVPDGTLEQWLGYAADLLYVALVVIAIRTLAVVVRTLVEWYFERVGGAESGQLIATVGPLTGKVVTLVFGAIGLIVVLEHFGVDIGALLVSLGVGSLAVALAAQETLANMIAGFVILIDRPFRVGDRVEVQGVTGDVREIGFRSTKILNFDGNLVVIPNSVIIKANVVNHASPFPWMRVKVDVGVAYGTDPDTVRRILTGLADGHPDVLKEPRPEVSCVGLGDSAVQYTLIARASDYRRRWDAENQIREGVLREFAAAGIEIPFPQRVVHLHGKV